VAERALLDTDIFSELMRGKNEGVRVRAEAYVKEHGRLSISAVTVLEVVKGFQKVGRQDALERFVQSLASVEVLVTGNEDHYKRIQAAGYTLLLDKWKVPQGPRVPLI